MSLSNYSAVFAVLILILPEAVSDDSARSSNDKLSAVNTRDGIYTVSKTDGDQFDLNLLSETRAGIWKLETVAKFPEGTFDDYFEVRGASWGRGRVVFVIGRRVSPKLPCKWSWLSYDGEDSSWTKGAIDGDSLIRCIALEQKRGDSVRCLFEQADVNGRLRLVWYHNDCIRFGNDGLDSGEFRIP